MRKDATFRKLLNFNLVAIFRNFPDLMMHWLKKQKALRPRCYCEGPHFIFTDHFELQHVMRIVYQDKQGKKHIGELLKLGRKKEFISKLSPLDAYLLGYLLGCEEGK
ncbi:MAG: hypothetical protein ACHQJ6_08150 [Candidatus Berkiellales bacterium]